LGSLGYFNDVYENNDDRCEYCFNSNIAFLNLLLTFEYSFTFHVTLIWK
jgi:hypothetical protein